MCGCEVKGMLWAHPEDRLAFSITRCFWLSGLFLRPKRRRNPVLHWETRVLRGQHLEQRELRRLS
jgi:hypothetical protein